MTVPLLGAHMSIAGGVHRAFARIREVRGQALQIFTKNQRQWHAPPLAAEIVALFKQQWEASGRMPVAAHDSYLVNLAAPDCTIVGKSVAAFAEELQRAAALGIPFLITHPGSYLRGSRQAGLERFVRHLDSAIAASETASVTILVETTAGQGSGLGSTFEEIAYIVSSSRFGDRLGVCFDTCHVFAAGYDLRSRAAYEKTMSDFDRVIGVKRLKFFHLNDCKKPLGSRVDRHEHIGKGNIGLEGFRLLLNDERFQDHPMVLETPKEQGLEKDKENLELLRSLILPGV